MKKHILFIIENLAGGGAENITLTLAKNIFNYGYYTTVLSLNKTLDYEILDSVNYLVAHTEKYRGMGSIFFKLKHATHILDELLPNLFQRYGQPSLVISSLHKTDRIVVNSKILQSCNVWFCIHGVFSHSYLSNKNSFKLWIKKIKIKKVYKNKNLISVSNAVSADLTKNVGVTPNAIKTIYNPFNIEEILHHAAQNNPFAEEDYILHVGRFHQIKRHDRLLDAFASLNLPSKLILLGKGKPLITNMIKDKIIRLNLQKKVIMFGFIKNPFPIIKGAKVIVLSSDSEGLPSILIEALICHTPIVSTLCPGGVAEIMTGELQSFLAELNSKSLAEKIEKAWYFPPIITEVMYKKFSSKTIIDQYLALQNNFL